MLHFRLLGFLAHLLRQCLKHSGRRGHSRLLSGSTFPAKPDPLLEPLRALVHHVLRIGGRTRKLVLPLMLLPLLGVKHRGSVMLRRGGETSESWLTGSVVTLSPMSLLDVSPDPEYFNCCLQPLRLDLWCKWWAFCIFVNYLLMVQSLLLEQWEGLNCLHALGFLK